MEGDNASTSQQQIESTTASATSTVVSTSTTDHAPISTPQTESSLPAQDSEKSDEKPKLKFTQPFLAAHTAYTRQRPHATEDLIDLYGITWLARTVARTDPVTGEKINKLRRSYEGQIKLFGLAGRNKAIKHDPSHGIKLLGLAQAPEEDFHNSRVAGKEVTRGLSSTTQARLAKILELAPGSVPRNAEWENALGVDKAKGAADDAKVKKDDRTKDVPQAAPRINGYTNGTTPARRDSEADRPKRSGRKRRYNDDSFEGYGEGFDDEDDASSDTGSRKSSGSKHKRPKIGGYPYP